MINPTKKLSKFQDKKRHNFILIFLMTILLAYIAIICISKITANILWYQEVGYLSAFTTQVFTKLCLGLFILVISAICLGLNLKLAEQQITKQNVLIRQGASFRGQSPPLKLYSLLLIIFSFVVLISSTLFYFTDIFIALSNIGLELPNLKPISSFPFLLNVIPRLETVLDLPIWQVVVLAIVITVVLLAKTNIFIGVICFYYSFLMALISAQYWFRFLHFFNSISFGEKEPIFGHDLGFYIFQLPFLQLISLWLESLLIICLATVTIKYLLAHNSVSDGKFRGFDRFELRHLYGIGSGLMLVLALIHWLNRYVLLLSVDGVVHGAAYTDMNINLPRETGASIFALGLSIWLLFKCLTGAGQDNRISLKNKKFRLVTLSMFPVILYFSFYGTGLLLAQLVQNTIVQPNELALEEPYINNNIDATRAAFNLDKIEVQTFNPEGNLTAEDIERNNLTINNIRLWDTLPILKTNRQLQQIRPYYVFYDADIDRYNIQKNSSSGESKQVIISPRELDAKLLPEQAQTWVNQHLVYTHGYGFTMSPVNRVAEGGLPYYFIQDIGTESDPGALNTSSEEVRASIPIYRPRIYYGEVTTDYVMTNTSVPEFDFPSGQDNTYTTYDGTGGVNIASFWDKLLFSVYLKDWRMLLTNNVTPETRILFRRDLTTRLSAIAPFLSYDRDPYLVVAKGEEDPLDHLYWLIDSYTISNYYPYSDGGENQFNYIRNSVKVVINAENGDVKFYVSDEDDPIIKVWQKIFPNLFQKLDDMPPSIREHIRYPIDLFSTQSERLLSYHMTDAQVFYNREDQWNVPGEIYANEVRSVQPYYLIMKLPIGQKEEFILLHPYTPISRPNLIAWLAARCDGENYGKLLLYQFPKQKLIFGPDQIEALINQEPAISGQISLWNRQGSKVIQGHLLIIPIEESLLYVEPLYIEAEKNSVPTLARVIVVYENQIVMDETLEKALNNIFTPAQTEENSAIIRSLDNTIIPSLETDTPSTEP